MSGSWVTRTMVIPRSSFSRWKIPRISSLVEESRFPVGSSARIIAGVLTIARAIATRCCSPPDSCDGRWCARSASPTEERAVSARSRRSGADVPS